MKKIFIFCIAMFFAICLYGWSDTVPNHCASEQVCTSAESPLINYYTFQRPDNETGQCYTWVSGSDLSDGTGLITPNQITLSGV